MQYIDNHEGTVTSVRFTHDGDELALLSAGADKKILKHVLSGKVSDQEPFKLKREDTYKNKIFSMDVSGEGLILTGHDKNLTLVDSETLEKKWQKRPDPNRKIVPDHIKVMMDDMGLVAATSQTDKQVMLFETETGRLLCKSQCGEITTGMCFTDNKKHLITCSSLGVIYIWKLPDSVLKIF